MATEEVTEEKVELSKEAQSILDTVEKLSVLELSKLVKALEDKFGVVAAAPAVAVAAAPGAGDAGDDAGSGASTVSAILADCGASKIQVLKAVRELTGLGLKEAKELVDAAPTPIKEGIDKEEAEKIKASLEEQGATVEIK